MPINWYTSNKRYCYERYRGKRKAKKTDKQTYVGTT